MEPISIRKLDNFYGKDRRIINSGLLKGESNYYPEQTRNSFYHLYHKRSVLNYDGNSLFTGFGNSFYNPFFTRQHIDTYYESNSPFYGYLLKSNRDIITLPVIKPVPNEVYEEYSNYVCDNFKSSEYATNPRIFENYTGKDSTMAFGGYFLRSDGHYIMDPLDNAIDFSFDNYAEPYNFHKIGENHASVLYYIPFFDEDMYCRKTPWDEMFANTVGYTPFNFYDEQIMAPDYFPEGYVNITIGPADIFTMGQTYHAILDFEPYLFYSSRIYGTSDIYVLLRLATKGIKLGTNGFVPRNHIYLGEYAEKCVFLNYFQEKYVNFDNSRQIRIVKKNDMRDNVICFIKAEVINTSQRIRNSVALDIEWRWGLKHTKYHVDDGSAEDMEVIQDVLEEGYFNCTDPGKYICPFLEVNIKPLDGEDFHNVVDNYDYNSSTVHDLFR